MRDPNRILPLCAEIYRLWVATCPDWRFMQLMSNFAVWYGKDPFYMEDDDFISKFTKFINQMPKERE